VHSCTYTGAMHDYLSEITERAARCGIPVGMMLQEAGVAPSTWWRWTATRFAPRFATLARINDVLCRAEMRPSDLTTAGKRDAP
jgi:hypothetical protein